MCSPSTPTRPNLELPRYPDSASRRFPRGLECLSSADAAHLPNRSARARMIAHHLVVGEHLLDGRAARQKTNSSAACARNSRLYSTTGGQGAPSVRSVAHPASKLTAIARTTTRSGYPRRRWHAPPPAPRPAASSADVGPVLSGLCRVPMNSF